MAALGQTPQEEFRIVRTPILLTVNSFNYIAGAHADAEKNIRSSQSS